MTRKFIDRLKRMGLLNLAGLVAVVSILFNIYQFSVNKKIQREAQELQLHESRWDWFKRAEHLAVQRDSMVSVFLSEYNRAWELALLGQRKAGSDSVSASAKKLISASEIWEREAEIVVGAMTAINRELNPGLENDSGGWFPQDLVKHPPRSVACRGMNHVAQLRHCSAIDSLDLADHEAWKKASAEFLDEFVWLYPICEFLIPEYWKIDKP